jgi:hypothetical protein
MYEIRISLVNAASLGTMAAPVVGMGALPAGMMANQRIYLILNTATNNRYVGISSNVQSRFNGRMAVVNELGLSAANMGVVWAWWGQTSTRRITAAIFPVAYAASIVHGAGTPAALANGYATPVVLPQICAAPHPNGAGAAGVAALAAQNAVAFPIRVGVAAYQAWTASMVPRTALTIAGAWPAIGVALPPGVALAASGQASAQAAAQAAATHMGAPLAVAVAAAAAVQARATGGIPAASDAATVVSAYYGGAAPAAPVSAALVPRDPVHVGGGVTTQTYTMPGGVGVIDLEHVFIRFVLNHLAGGFVTNGAKTGPIAWPGGAEPICVTWHSCAGGGFAIYDRSVMWWPGTVF